MAKRQPQPQQDLLRVHTYPERVVVDLLEDERTECYLAFMPDEIVIRMGMEKVVLTWPAILQVKETIEVAEKIYRTE